MKRVSVRAGVALLAGAALAAGLASCEQILGLDDDLSGADASRDAAADGADGSDLPPQGDAGPGDATTGDGGSDAADASPVVDAALPTGPWALDPGYGTDGVLTLQPMATAFEGGNLELVNLQDGASGSVYLVGVGGDSGGGKYFVFCDVGRGAPTAIAEIPLNGGAYRLLGAFPGAGGLTALVQDDDTYGLVSVFLATSASSAMTVPLSNTQEAVIARLVDSTDAGFVGPAYVKAQPKPRAVEATVTSSVAPAFLGAVTDTVIAQGQGDDGVWFGGYQRRTSPQTAVLFRADDAGAEVSLISGVADAGDFGITDFASAGGALWAVGYTGAAFAVWPASYGSAVPSAAPTGGTVPFTASPAYEATTPYSFVRAAVSFDQNIVLSGGFGDPYLATFDGSGKPSTLLASSVGDAPQAVADMATVLPALQSNTSWHPGGVLSVGANLYAAYASTASPSQWAVIRLTRTGLSP